MHGIMAKGTDGAARSDGTLARKKCKMLYTPVGKEFVT